MKDNEEDYLSLLREKQLANDLYDNKISKVKKKINKQFRKDNKNIILILDIMMVFIILFNLGAVVTTNLLVVNVEPQVVVLEANPVTAELHNYEPHPQGREIMNAVMRKMFMWTLLIFSYIWIRTVLLSTESLWILFFMVLFWFVSTGLDFMNNFGYTIGKLIYGG